MLRRAVDYPGSMRRRVRLVSLIAALAGLAACGASSPAPGSASHAELSWSVDAVPGGHALAITNQSGGARSFHREIAVERRAADGTWSEIAASGLFLRESCEQNDPPACVEVANGTTFRAAPWTGMVGDAQCACEECGPAGAGTYRFVFRRCDGDTRLESASFDVH